jgi:hypothetical protein
MCQQVSKYGRCSNTFVPCLNPGLQLGDKFELMVGIPMDWVCVLAFNPGAVDQVLSMRNEYPVVENWILKVKLKMWLQLIDADRFKLANIIRRLGRESLEVT